MSEEILKHLQGEVARLQRELADTAAEAKKYRLARRQLKDELAALQTDHQRDAGELEKLRQHPGALQAELDQLKGEIRTRDHRTAFERVAKGLKVKDNAIEDLWKLADYHADTDVADEDAIKTLLIAAVENRRYLLADEVEKPVVKPPLVTGAGAGRGKAAADLGGFTLSRADSTNQGFMRLHQAEIAAAVQAGTLHWTE